MRLNPQQQKAVEHVDGPALVISAPGSGKTAVISARVVKLISERGIKASGVLCVTFTNKAAREMRERIKIGLGASCVDCTISTFHAFCVRILRKFGHHLGYSSNFSILDESDQLSLINQIGKRLGFKKDKFKTYPIISVLNKSRENLENLEQMAGRFGKDVVGWEIAKIYLEELPKNNAIDFSGLLSETWVLFQKYSDVLKQVQDRYLHILVDETQDTNYIQFALINLLALSHKNIMIVGDPNQSIFKFRGARYQNILDFIKQYPDCVQYELGKNYRSTPQIIKVAETLIKHNSSHMLDKFETDNADGPPVTYNIFESPQDEAIAIARRIKRYIDECGIDPSEIAVFYRLNRLSLELQPALKHVNIPFRVLGGPGFFDRSEVKTILAMMKFLSNPKDSAAFYRIIDIFDGIGETTAHKLNEIARKQNISLIEACQNIDSLSNRVGVRSAAKRIEKVFNFDYGSFDVNTCFNSLLSETKYMNWLEAHTKTDQEFAERKDNVDALIADAIDYTDNDTQRIDAYLKNVSLMTSEDTENGGAKITLQTIHSAKGLEFTVVILIGVEQKILPHYLAMLEATSTEERIEALEEEARLFFVAVTRAKKYLHISSCKYRKTRKGSMFVESKCYPSQFLFEAGLLKNIENNKGIYIDR